MGHKKAQKAQEGTSGARAKRGSSPTVREGAAVPSKAKTSRKGAKAQSVRSPRVSKDTVSNDALPDGRASDIAGFPPTLGEMDLHLFGEGKHERIYEKLGAHATTHDGKRGVAFAVWAPNAKSVSV